MIRTSLVALLVASSLAVAAPVAAQTYDVVIRNGRILDGAGNPWVSGDIAIKDGRIARVGSFPGRGKREIEAAGRIVSPGFIDMMDQSSEVLLRNGAAENKLRMGVTSVIAGEGGTPVDADKIPGYFAQMEKQGIAINFGTYYSVAQARVKVMGDAAGAPTPAQLDKMRAEVDRAMHAGAFGISSALIYPPDSFQTTADLVEMAKVAGRCNGFYATHMRDESAKLVEAINEAIEIAEKGGVKLEIFHLKAAYAPKFGELMPKALAAIETARARGVDVAADMYPYTAGGTGLSITVPNWVFADGEQKAYERLRDPTVRERLKREIVQGSQPGWSNLLEASGGWDKIVLANAYNKAYDADGGKSIAAIAKERGRDPADVAWDIVVEALPNRAMALFFMMDERDIEQAMKKNFVSIGTDAAASEGTGKVDALGLPHPRAYGTFPRVLANYVRERGVLTLEDAVRKMTSWPAARMGLDDRGVVREGLRADLIVFDPSRVQDRATWKEPTAGPEGIDYVLVNGAIAIDNGTYTGAKSGRVLRHACKA